MWSVDEGRSGGGGAAREKKKRSKNLLCGSGSVGCGKVAGVIVASLFSPLSTFQFTVLWCERMLYFSEGPG